MSRAHVLAALAVAALLPACRPSNTVTDAGKDLDASPSPVGASAVDAGNLDTLEALAVGHGLGLGLSPGPLVVPSGTAPPMPAGAAPADREKELVGLLSGRVAPDALPVVPTDPGVAFDEGLRGRLTSSTRFTTNVTLGSIEVKGALAQREAARVVAMARARMRACYNSALSSNPAIEGGLRVKLEILPNGDVKTATSEAPPPSSHIPAGDVPKNAQLTECVVGMMRRLSFPTVDSGTSTVSFDARFEARGDTAR